MKKRSIAKILTAFTAAVGLTTTITSCSEQAEVEQVPDSVYDIYLL